MIQADGVTVLLGGRAVLTAVSLQAEAGQALLVTGANGAGKSVLARTLAGLQAPSAGRVTVCRTPGDSRAAGGSGAVDVRSRKARRLVGYLPQGGGLYDYLTVRENLGFFAAVAGVARRQRERVVVDLLEVVGLTEAGGLEASRLTPGQRQRLCLARTLVGDPPVLVLDEPLAGLDAGGRADVRHLVAELASLGKALVLLAGDPDGLPHDRTLTLSDGRLKGGDAA